jgi:hypothetical protein
LGIGSVESEGFGKEVDPECLVSMRGADDGSVRWRYRVRRKVKERCQEEELT